MVKLQLLVSSLCLASLSTAAALPPTNSAVCKNPIKRQEWRQLSIPQRRNYIDAVLCLTTKKAVSGIPGALNRFDDHQAVHVNQADHIHFVGHFILWHRYFVATYEKALREECGYAGAHPYWNYSLDAEPHNPTSTRVYDSEIFSPDTGFGGNGNKVEPLPGQNEFGMEGGTGGGCVQTGPFVASKFTVNYPGPADCLRRDFIPALMNTWADPKLVTKQLEAPDYTTFDRLMQGDTTSGAPNIHGSGHFGVGGALGQAGNAANSPAEPLFYLHHANLDRIFWEWQQLDLKTRLNQVGGPIIPFDYSGQNVTLDYTINIGKLAGDRKLKELLDTTAGPFCYTY
ncbi:hypothetical protein J4E81_009709 [Alternaria sp. BMP 2799]|uniref:uncharacterized protein n=1 Tax=Alternaria triticimaculans TaxID=297637 RepID=UPI0020C4CBB6|nr:uncharacterized protein J4E78_006496 [Alternaria triticimaculans]KAI4656607.1 hypothetical protein J4E78_006496 [Alternaria triticimaculans]KAI4681947.1 hypothetical protein J4E81_009709 [Alternaria sp. BMP 2799]